MKINKKLIAILILIFVAFLGFGIYTFYLPANKNPEKITDDKSGQDLPSQQVNVDNSVKPNPVVSLPGGVEVGGSGVGKLTICSDRCGDGVCQAIADPKCSSDEFECICLETKPECPADCK